MDRKVKKYEQILLKLLEEYSWERKATQTDYRSFVISDKEKHHYQVVQSGWYEGEFDYTVQFHFEIKPDGKVWLYQNNTDIPIAEELAERGVPRSEIILGFQPENLRQGSGFAVN
jgi:hypothetical protein